MKFILFYEVIELLNYFASKIKAGIISNGHKTYIIDRIRDNKLTTDNI